MRAHLHRPDAGAGLHGLGQLALQHIGKGGGVLSRHALTGPAVHQGAEQGGGLAAAAGEVLNQMGGGGLAVGAGHTDQLQTLAGVLPERRCQQAGPARHRFGHHQHRVAVGRGASLCGATADHRGHGTGLQGLRPEPATIHGGAGQANEQGAVPHPARIAADPAHLGIGQAGGNAQAGLTQQGMQPLGHGCRHLGATGPF